MHKKVLYVSQLLHICTYGSSEGTDHVQTKLHSVNYDNSWIHNYIYGDREFTDSEQTGCAYDDNKALLELDVTSIIDMKPLLSLLASG